MSIYKYYFYALLYVIITIIIYLLIFLPLAYYRLESEKINFYSNLGVLLFSVIPVLFIKIGKLNTKPFSYQKAIMFFILAVLINLSVHFYETFNFTLINQFDFANIYLFLGGVLLAPIVEEIIYRGILFTYLEKNGEKNIYRIIFFSALLFSLTHLPDLNTALLMFFIGLILGYIYNKERNIIYPIIVHIAYNFLAVY